MLFLLDLLWKKVSFHVPWLEKQENQKRENRLLSATRLQELERSYVASPANDTFSRKKAASASVALVNRLS